MLTHFSLFTGIGGADIAAKWAGFETIGQVEWADYPTKVLEKHWPDVPRWRDIKDVRTDNVRGIIGDQPITVISGGFPCQPFSVAGKRKGKDDDRFLWPEMLRVISELKPTWVIGENVNGFVNMGLEDACADLESQGYEVQPFVIPACAVGAWHERKRVFIVAYSTSKQNRGQHMSKLFKQNTRMEFTGSSERFDGKEIRCDMATRLFSDNTSNGWNSRECNWQERQIQSNRERNIEENKSEWNGRLHRFGKICSVFPNTRCKLCERCKQNGTVSDEIGKRNANIIERPGEMVFNSTGKRWEAFNHETGNTSKRETEWEFGSADSPIGHIWEFEPNVDRVANGIPNRVDRLKCLGNAIVPQQIYPIFQAIADIETRRMIC